MAQKLGVKIIAENAVTRISPIGKKDGSDGYEIVYKSSTSFLLKKKKVVRAKGVVLAGGVLGTVRLLLNMKK